MTHEEATQAHWHLVQEGELPQFVIYNSPSDCPGKYVVRMWRTIIQKGPTAMVAAVDSLEQAREIIPEGLHCMPRLDGDDPVIVEVWF